MTLWKPLLMIAALVLSLISIAMPTWQWASIPTSTAGQWLAGATAAALCVCKLGFMPLAWQHLVNRNWLPGICLGLFAGVFLAMNISASRDLLLTQSQSRSALNQQGSEHLQQLSAALTDINQSITTVNGLLASDLANNYRERAYQQHHKLENLQQQRDKLLAQLQSARQAAHNSQPARFGVSVSEAKGQPASNYSGELVAAVSVQVGCVLAVLACSAWAAPLPGRAIKKETVKPKNATPKPKSESAKPNAQQEKNATPLNGLQLALAEEIKAGVHGDNPSVKALIENKTIPGGYNKINPVFLHLVASGDLKREGKGYQLTQLTIA
jgi:hypothetical protein